MQLTLQLAEPERGSRSHCYKAAEVLKDDENNKTSHRSAVLVTSS